MPKLISQKNFSNINVSGVTTTTSSQFALDSFLKSSFRSAKYQIQIDQGSSYQTTEFLVVHDGTTTYNTEFAIVKSGNILSTFPNRVCPGQSSRASGARSASNKLHKAPAYKGVETSRGVEPTTIGYLQS